MKILLEIPKEFEGDFKKVDYLLGSDTLFEDSMNRIKTDIQQGECYLSGMYELEIIKMLINVFSKAEIEVE